MLYQCQTLVSRKQKLNNFLLKIVFSLPYFRLNVCSREQSILIIPAFDYIVKYNKEIPGQNFVALKTQDKDTHKTLE